MSDNDIVVVNIPRRVAESIKSLGSSVLVSGYVSVDVMFYLKEEEVRYIVESLKLICEKGEEL